MSPLVLCGLLGLPTGQLRGGHLKQNQVVLSFDDGPNNVTSPILLDVLSANHIHALFFHVGVNIDNPDLMDRFVREGHCTGVHTMGHPHLTSLSSEQAHVEIDESVRIFQRVAHTYPRFFRAPYGEINSELTRYVHDRGMISVLWDVDSSDWRVHHDLASRIGARVHAHGIILLHEYTWTTNELQQIVDTIRADGLEIVHPLELLSPADLESLRSVECSSSTVQAWCRYTASHEKREL